MLAKSVDTVLARRDRHAGSIVIRKSYLVEEMLRLGSVSPTGNGIRFGIRHKIIAVLLVVLTLAMTVTGWFMIRHMRDSMEREANHRRSFFVGFVAQSLVYNVVGHDYHTLQLLLDEMTRAPEISYAKVLSGKGNVMAESGHWPPRATDALLTEPIVHDGHIVGQVMIAFDKRVATKQIEAQKNRLVANEFIVTLLIALGEFAALSYLIVRPLRTIGRALDSGVDAEGRIVYDIPKVSHDEIGRLALQFNFLRDQLNAANDKLKSRMEFADEQLRRSNVILKNQSEELQRMNQELLQLSVTDALTGLFNRRHIESTIDREMDLTRRHGNPFGLILIDIDHFKNVNDNYGHVVGDKVLRHVAQTLSHELRSGDVVGRIGGEEFVVVCRHLDMYQSIEVAEKLRALVERTPYVDEQLTVRITVSIGVATFTPRDNMIGTANAYLHAADRALYHSKRNGRNRVTHVLQIGGGFAPMEEIL